MSQITISGFICVGLACYKSPTSTLEEAETDAGLTTTRSADYTGCCGFGMRRRYDKMANSNRIYWRACSDSS